jgi:hypothetical protein
MPPRLNCGDCLMDRCKVVDLKMLTSERPDVEE